MSQQLALRVPTSAIALRGYNIANIGRTAELRRVPAYCAVVDRWLKEYSRICAEVVERPVDLSLLVSGEQAEGLDRYAESVALVAAVEMAQLELLESVHDVPWRDAKLAFGYSLGEVVAVGATGMFDAEGVIRVPLAMATQCAALAGDVTMGVFFSREAAIEEAAVSRLCEEVTQQGAGAIGVSTILSPNSYLVLGQRETLKRFTALAREAFPRSNVRANDSRWPPLHTPIVRQNQVPDRASVMMQTLKTVHSHPTPPVLSLVTGKLSYGVGGEREILRDWVDHPQRLWDAVCHVLASGVRTIIHVGPEPNLVPATFQRLAENVRQQTRAGTLSSLGIRAVQGLAERDWLASLLPMRSMLLRAPLVQQIVLEDWLLENAPSS
ncbi:hypothetical protein Pla175_33010 [Pirellulimonas nuda]|uniref:[acyl-carrier-protein] S-malonyltransferase n=1 Tax=Pirellulimonas nuda TaxID=2528009 RepID=A0A518DEJ9_9BACT|nr:ACP S-malonyltransferase [Pirellulimonas nuda]QDU89904.1 hypothetical protein Pla175_33010 [Pirellulimonas nuda]